MATARPANAPSETTTTKTAAKPATGGVDAALLGWIAKNYPGATNIHTGDSSDYLNGHTGEGAVFTYNYAGHTLTYLLPNRLPQYGIGGTGSSDTEPAYLHDPALNDRVYGTATAPGANPNAGQATAAALTRQYNQVDNGQSSLIAYGFGQNRYSDGAPVGGYTNPAGTPGTPSSAAQATGSFTPSPWMQNLSTAGSATAAARTGIPTAPGVPATGTPAASTAAASAPSNLTTAQRDAWGYLKGILDTYGLGSLSQFVITELTAGRSQEEIALDLQNTPEFKQAFPEIAARRAAGLPAISPGEIVSYRNSATQLMRAAGLPQGFYDSPQDLQGLIGNDVSLSELNDRIQAAKDATYNIDPAAQARLHQEFGLAPGSGELAAFFLDPQRATPILQRQLQAAQIGGAADQVGYGNLNNATALDLAQAGVTGTQARQGFNQLGMESQLFTGLPGQAEANIGQGQQLAGAFLGNVDAQQTIERRRQSRLAAFGDGGGFASTSKGTAAGSAGQG